MRCARISGNFLIVTLTWIASQQAVAANSLPSFERVTKVVLDQFAHRTDFHRGDLISQRDVEPIFDQLHQLGWAPADSEGVFDAFLPDNALLVRELETPAGRQFMRKVERFPGVYDRLERLSWLADGAQILHGLIHQPQGVEQLRLMTTPAGMAQVASRIASDPRGANFSLPSGRIHTVDELLQSLNEAHAAVLANRQSKGE